MKTTYYNLVVCENCYGELSSKQEIYSDGRCPLCGYKSKSACTVISSKDLAYTTKRIRTQWHPKKFWKFFETTRTLHAFSDEDKETIRRHLDHTR